MEISEFGIKRSTKIVIVAVMATVIIAEIVACLCMGSVKPAESLVIDYEAAKESMSDMEKEEYEENRKNLIEKAENDGYAEEKLAEIYQKCKDSYGYLSYTDVQKALEEVKNG